MAMDQKNLFLAIAVSLAILLGWQFFIEGPRREQLLAEQQRQEQLAQRAAPAGQAAPGAAGVFRPSTIGTAGVDGEIQPRSEAITASRQLPKQACKRRKIPIRDAIATWIIPCWAPKRSAYSPKSSG